MNEQEQLIDRLVNEVIRAEERGDTVSAEFLNRCLVNAVRQSER